MDSLRPLNAELLIVDGGSNDGTKEWCHRKGLKVFEVGEIKDYAKLRNSLIGIANYDWQLVIHPWEVITDPEKIISVTQREPQAYALPILRGDSIAYEERLWNRTLNIKFKNPVFERLDVSGIPLSSIIFSDGDWLPEFDIIRNWKSKCHTSEPIYYETFYHLQTSQWNEFLSCASQYLFVNQTALKSTMMMKYYSAIVYCHIKKDLNAALKHIIECIAVKPLMAEYWCVLGDIYYFISGDAVKAKRFYKNAIILGSKRGTDAYPVEFSKYREYPERMIGRCEKLKCCNFTRLKNE